MRVAPKAMVYLARGVASFLSARGVRGWGWGERIILTIGEEGGWCAIATTVAAAVQVWVWAATIGE